jgi:hypothetical protein
MNTITFTPTDQQSAGFAFANAKAKAIHDSAQLVMPEQDRTSYSVTDEQYAVDQLKRMANSYFNQMIDERGEAAWEFVRDVITYRDVPDVSAKLDALIASVNSAKEQ